MKWTIAAATLVSLVAASSQADAAERNVWNEELTSSRVLFSEMDQAMRTAPSDGPERVIYTWTVTCIVDAKTNTKVTEPEESWRAACEKWAKSPAARMQKPIEPTPYTAGKQNAQVIWKLFPTAEKSEASVADATAEQKRMSATCIVDAVAAFGAKEGLTVDRVKACARMAGLKELKKKK